MVRLLRCFAVGSVIAVAALTAAGPVLAQSSTKTETELTPEEIAERESRKGCKLDICAAFHLRKADAADVACNIRKTWRKEALTKLLQKGGLSWPWNSIACVADIKLKREMLIKAMVESKYEAVLDLHKVSCAVEQPDAKDKSDVTFEIQPKVKFEAGKATAATLNWGKIEAPMLLKGALWTATATDNALNVLQTAVVEDINDFIGVECLKVKDEWPGK